MRLRKRFFLLELGTITLLAAIMFVSGTSRPWLSFLLMVGVITAHGLLFRRLRCPKCLQPIGEGPGGMEILGWDPHYCTPWPAKKCRFCGERIN